MCVQDESYPEDYEFSGLLPIYEQLSEELKKLHAAVLQGRHVFGVNLDLVFMSLVDKWKGRIPFYSLFATLNMMNKQGLRG